MTTTNPTPTPPPRSRLPQVMVLVLTLTLILGIFLIGTLLRAQNDAESEETTTTTVVAANTTSTTATTAPITTTEAATTTSVETTTTTTTAPPDPTAGLRLRASGLGQVVFGTDADQTISAITEMVGAPSEDTGWDPFNFPTCPGEQVRVVRWASLEVFFSDGATDWAPAGTPHFFHYGHSVFAGSGESLDLATENGVRLGTTVAELKEAYGPDVLVIEDPSFGGLWEVDVPGAGILWGAVNTVTDDGVVESINGGAGCGE
jgi:hypothetical protein